MATPLLAPPAKGNSDRFGSAHNHTRPQPTGPISRDYSVEDRIRYQLWPYVWKRAGN
jgi:hypothetical protein